MVSQVNGSPLGGGGGRVVGGSGRGIQITEGFSWGRAVTQRAEFGPVGGSGQQIVSHSNRIPEGEWGTLQVVCSLSLEERKHSDDHAGRMLHSGFRQRILRLGLWPLIPFMIQ